MDTLGKIKNIFSGNRKVTNSNGVSGNDFLKFGNRRGTINEDWSTVQMSDSEYYNGYSYAAINNRANKVAQIATQYITSDADKKLVEQLINNNQEIIHPYLSLINDSDYFTQTEFWYNISTYLDLEGVYYLMAVRKVSERMVGQVQYFQLLNPYEVQRVINRETMEVGGYIENRSGLVREIPKEMIIEIRKLNPFSRERPFAMTDAAKEFQFALKQANDYTRSSLKYNVSSPGIISTDVVLEPENFVNFQARVNSQERGAPIFANGANAVTYQPMNIDMDKAALSEINEINRSTVFAVSGVSKTTMGIEESGTTRETARVQKDKFTEDHIMPQVQMVVDALNQDYKKYYKKEWQANKYSIVLDSPLSADVGDEIQSVKLRSDEYYLVTKMIEVGYEFGIASKYAAGEMDIEEIGEPTMEPELTPEEIQAIAQYELAQEAEQNDTEVDTVSDTVNSEVKTAENFLVKKKTNHIAKGINRDKIDKVKQSLVFFEEKKKKQIEKIEEDIDHYNQSSYCNHEHNSELIKAINALDEESKDSIGNAESSLMNSITNWQALFIASILNSLNNDVDFTDINKVVSKQQMNKAQIQLKGIVEDYYDNTMPIYGGQQTTRRNMEFGTSNSFSITPEVKNYIEVIATDASQSHVATIANDILKSGLKVYQDTLDELVEGLTAKRIVDSEDIFEEARRMAAEGMGRGRVISALTEKYNDVSKTRARTIARTESNRAFSQSQFQADLQFLNSMGLTDRAYKQWITTSDEPCEFCIDLSLRPPIPFNQNFQDLGTSISYDYTKKNGDITKRTLNIDYEPLNAGNAHVNCACRYKLILKDEFGNFIQNGFKEIFANAGKGNPYRDMKSGQYTDAPFSKKMTEKGSNRKGIDELKKNTKVDSYFKSKTFYHGTSGAAAKSISDGGFNIGKGEDRYGSGIYFVSDSSVAQSYGKWEESGKVISVKINSSKPYKDSWSNSIELEVRKKMGNISDIALLKRFGEFKKNYADVVDSKFRDGYDSVIIKDSKTKKDFIIVRDSSLIEVGEIKDAS